MKSPFVGTWLCQFYTWDNDTIAPVPHFPLTIKQDKEGSLDGTYPLENHADAVMWGPLTNDGRVWVGTFKGILEGTFVFVLSDDSNSFHGAWVLDKREGPPQPWWGYKKGKKT
jgi:hypothetical protein